MAIRKRTWTTRKGETKTAWVVDYKDQGGKRRLKTFERKREAERFATTAGYEIRQGIHTPDSASVTLAQAADLWIERGETEGLERSTIKQYRSHVAYHIKPSSIGHTKLSQLSTPTVEAFRRELETARGKPMARKVLRSLKAILREAQRQGLVAQNAALPVTVRMDTRASQRPEIGVNVPSKDEARQIIEASPSRWRPLIVTATFTGLRSSELRGLRWDNVDFDAGVIRVRERADAWNQHAPPKSTAGNRDVPMTPIVRNTLREWRLACPKGDANLVFPNTLGRHENHANIINRGLAPAQKACEIVDDAGKAKYGVHALRHFCASWLIGQGFQPKRIQRLMGHSTVQMTFDVYGHWLETDEEHDVLAAAEQDVMGVAQNAT